MPGGGRRAPRGGREIRFGKIFSSRQASSVSSVAKNAFFFQSVCLVKDSQCSDEFQRRGGVSPRRASHVDSPVLEGVSRPSSSFASHPSHAHDGRVCLLRRSPHDARPGPACQHQQGRAPITILQVVQSACDSSVDSPRRAPRSAVAHRGERGGGRTRRGEGAPGVLRRHHGGHRAHQVHPHRRGPESGELCKVPREA